MLLPGLQLDCAKLNMFWLGNYAQIPYRVFVSTRTGAEKSDLVQAEAEVRKSSPHSVMKTMSSELWIFSLEDKSALLEPDNKFGLKETSTGIFLCSTLATADGPAPTAYKPFIFAVRHLLSLCILSSIPGSLLLKNSIYLPDRRLLNIETFLSIDGDLYFRASIEHVSLISVERKPCSKNDTILMTPIGISGSYLGRTKRPSSDSPPIEQLQLLTGLSNFDGEFSEDWLDIEIEQGKVVTWPAEFALHYETDKIATSRKSEKMHIDSVWDKLWVSTRDMAKIRAGDSADKELVESHQSSQKTLAASDSLDTRSIQGASAVYPTPPDPQNLLRSQKNVDFGSESKNWSPSNVNNNWGELDEELFGANDGVTEADFDFFDQPEPSSSPKMEDLDVSRNSENHSILDLHDNSSSMKTEATHITPMPVPPIPEKSNIGIKLGLSDISPVKAEDELTDQESKKRSYDSTFAPISFKKSIKFTIDMKYDQGGRFFLPNPDDVEEDSDHLSSSSSLDEDQIQATTPSSLPDYDDDHEISGDIDSETASSVHHVPGYFQDEIVSYLTHTNIKDNIIRNSKDLQSVKNDEEILKVMEVLLDQIVWDSGLLDSILPQEIACDLPCQGSLNAVKKQFSKMSQLTLEEFLQSVSVSSQNVGNLKRDGTNDAGTVTESRISDIERQSSPFKTRPQSYAGDDISMNHTESENYAARISGGSYHPGAAQKILPNSRQVIEDVIQLTAPLYTFYRMQEPLKAREPILRFWKIFGLAPFHGTKDMDVMCCCPSANDTRSFIAPFLEQLQNCYEVCELGTMRLLDVEDSTPGLLSMNMDEYELPDLSMEWISAHAYEVCARISAGLDQKASKNRILFIIINPHRSIRSLISLGKFMTCIKNILGETRQIAFQLMPLDSIYSSESLTVASQDDSTRLALQIYDRFSSESLQKSDKNQGKIENLTGLYRNSPAYSLALVPPVKLNFRVAPTPPSSLLEEDTILHIAYGISKDSRWAVVAWCDQWGGKCQMSISSLGEKQGRLKAFEDMCADVWDKTLKLCALKPIKWRIAIVRAGAMEESEQRVWLRYIESSSECISAGFLLQSDMGRSMLLSDSLDLFPYGKHVNDRSQENLIISKSPMDLNSPTPRKLMDMDSPDTNMTNASTPGKTPSLSLDPKNEESLRLIDVENDVFGILFRTRIPLPPSGTLDRLRPTIGGLLVQHDSSISPGRPRCGEFIILHTPANPVVTMKMLLFHYRQLASLACQTGVSKHTVQPWHIEAVMKILRLLDAV